VPGAHWVVEVGDLVLGVVRRTTTSVIGLAASRRSFPAPKKAKKQLQEVAKALTQYAHRLNRLSARKKIASLR
jgi:hypothetical protein